MASSDPTASNNPELQLDNLFNVKDRVALVTGGGRPRFQYQRSSTRSELTTSRFGHRFDGGAGPRSQWGKGLHSWPH